MRRLGYLILGLTVICSAAWYQSPENGKTLLVSAGFIVGVHLLAAYYRSDKE